MSSSGRRGFWMRWLDIQGLNMADIARTDLFGKLNRVGYQAVEGATTFCKMRGNPYVELAHWIHQLLQTPRTDLQRIIDTCDLDASRIAADLTRSLEQLPRGATAVSDFSPHLELAVREAWTYATLLFGSPVIRTGHVLVALLKTPSLHHLLTGISPVLASLSADRLTDEFAVLTRGSTEEDDGNIDRADVNRAIGADDSTGPPSAAIMGKQEALAQFSVDLTEKARNDEIDPIVGRDAEIRQIIDILMRLSLIHI